MKIVIVANPVSGRGQARRHGEALGALLADHGHEVVTVASEQGASSGWLSSHLSGADAVAVVGGDGTVRSVASTVAEASVPLVHVPRGNENLFARELGMGPRLEDTLALIEGGTRRPVDMAAAGGHVMLLMASIGFDAEIVSDVASRRRDRVSNWHYIRGGLRVLGRWRPPRLTVRVDGEQVVSEQPGWVVISNASRYGGRINPAPMARMDDRHLDLTFFRASSALQHLAWMVRCRAGRQAGREGYVHVPAHRDITISCSEPSRWQLDGDPPPDPGPDRLTELSVALLPQPLHVLAPPTPPPDHRLA